MSRKILTLVLALAMALSLASCSNTNSTPASDASTTTDTSVVVTDPSDVSADTSLEYVYGFIYEDPSQNVSDISFEKEDKDYTSDSGSELLRASIPSKVMFSGDAINLTDAVKLAITNDVQSIYEKQTKCDEELFEVAKAQFADSSASFNEDGMYYYNNVDIYVTRADDAVVSMVVASDNYTGGAHGNADVYGLNYDTQTGEHLTFDMLGADFRATAEDFVLGAADAKQAEEECLFDEYKDCISQVVCDGTETFGSLYGIEDTSEDTSTSVDDETVPATFYMTSDSIVFVSNEALQPHASGIIEFPLGYTVFEGVINSQYVPQ